jgi:hypothetical protein
MFLICALTSFRGYCLFILVGVLLWSTGDQLIAQTITNSATAITTNAPAAALHEPEQEGWSFYASLYGYIVPDSRDYLQPTFSADHDWLHLEARYNYEAFETGSAWVGYNFGGGEELVWEVTPMLGAVFGKTTGIAPGFKGYLHWWKLELSTECEYVFDTRHSGDSFFYNWTEFSISPWEWLRVGLADQRTRLYKTDREIQRGFLVGVSWRKISLTTYVFNPDESRPVVVIAGGVTF